MDSTEKKIVDLLKSRLPQVQAIYLFGSRASALSGPQSDYDLAVYLPSPTEPGEIWETAQFLARELDCDVDLVDLRTASTVMQHQIISKGKRLWKEGSDVDYFETYALRDKLDLDERREKQIREILETGSVYGNRYPGQQSRGH